MMLLRRGCLICSCTTPSMTLSFMPLSRAFRKAWSRSGPWVPAVPARSSAWQLPQVPSPMKSSLPFSRSALPPLVAVQPAAAAARAAAATAAQARRQFLWESVRGGQGGA